MGTFTFNGSSATIVAGTVGFGQGWDGTNNSFSVDANVGVGISLNGFSFGVRCPAGCNAFQEGDYITVSQTTLLFATKTRVRWKLCGGDCRGSLSYWGPGLGLGISGQMKFKFNS